MRKRIIAVLALLCVLIFIVGCKSKQSPPQVGVINESSVAVSKDKTINETTDFYTIKAVYPVDSRDKNNLVENYIKSEVEKRKTDWKIGGELYKKEQEYSKKYPDRPKYQYEYEIEYKKYECAKLNAVSYLFTTYEFTGGPHGSSVVKSFTFDENGIVDISQILNLNESSEIAISKLLKAKLKESLDESTDDTMITNGLGLNYVNDDGTLDKLQLEKDNFQFMNNFANFSLLDEGIKFDFDQYQVGPGAAGVQEATIPWAELKSYLQPNIADKLK